MQFCFYNPIHRSCSTLQSNSKFFLYTIVEFRRYFLISEILRYVLLCYGQSLRPIAISISTSGTFLNFCCKLELISEFYLRNYLRCLLIYNNRVYIYFSGTYSKKGVYYKRPLDLIQCLKSTFNLCRSLI